MQKLVIAGMGMAAGKLLEELLLLNNTNYEITVIGDEPYGNYDRIKLSLLFSENEPEGFWLNSKKWLKSKNIKTLLGEKAAVIDRNKKNITTDKGNTVSYDKLVIATGSSPYIPGIEGISQPGIFFLRNIDDVNKIKNHIAEKNKILVIGGGLLGLELAWALHKTGKEITVSHLVDSLMEMQLNKEASVYLEKKLNAAGIKFVMNTYATNIIKKEDSSFKVDFKNGKILDTQTVIINCGIKPNKELAELSGLTVNKGIVVNEKLLTEDNSIYALGECIEYNGQTYGIIAPIYEQARTLAKILNNEKTIYPNSPLPPAKLKSEASAIAMGKINEEENDIVIKYENPLTNVFKKIIINDNKIAGAHLVGEDLNSDALGVYFTAKLPLPNRIEQLLFPGVHKPGVSSLSVYWPNNITICDCNGITLKTIRSALKDNKGDIDKIVKATRAGSACGTCKNRIQSIIENTYDAIIVGAGLGGLSAGATLAKYGKKVLVIEKHDKVGGYATAFTREGYKFDASLHNLGPIYGAFKEIFSDLGLLDKIKYIPFKNFQRIIFPDDDIDLPKGIDSFADILIEKFPEEKEGITNLFEEIKTIRKGFDEFEHMSLSGNPEDMMNPMMAVAYPQFIELAESTFGDFMNKYIKNDKLIGLIGNVWWYFGAPPGIVAALMFAVQTVGYIEHAGGNVEGTSQNISNALSDIILSNHGRVILNTEVKKILLEDKTANGVLTEEGEIFYSDIVVSNIGAVNTLKITDPEQIKKRYKTKVDNLEISLSALQLYLGLNCDPKKLGMKDHTFTVFPSYDHNENYKNIIDGTYEKTFFCCLNYTSFDKTTAPDGKGILNIFTLDHIKNWEGLTESQYKAKKEKVIKITLDKAEKYIPGLKNHIVVAELGTPKTMNRYTFNPQGSIYGPSFTVEQSGMMRLQAITPMKGLMLVGSSIYPGGGYPSVISSGYKAAKTVLFYEKSNELKKTPE